MDPNYICKIPSPLPYNIIMASNHCHVHGSHHTLGMALYRACTVGRGKDLRATLESCLPCYVTSGKLPNLFKIQFSYLEKRGDKSSHIELLQRLKRHIMLKSQKEKNKYRILTHICGT